jgi:hypothetical protein
MRGEGGERDMQRQRGGEREREREREKFYALSDVDPLPHNTCDFYMFPCLCLSAVWTLLNAIQPGMVHWKLTGGLYCDIQNLGMSDCYNDLLAAVTNVEHQIKQKM